MPSRLPRLRKHSSRFDRVNSLDSMVQIKLDALAISFAAMQSLAEKRCISAVQLM